MKKVLSVLVVGEKDRPLQDMIRRFSTLTFGDDTVVLIADTPSKVKYFYANYHHDLGLVLIDRSWKDEVQAFDLACSSCGEFKGPVVAISSVATSPHKVIPPGCTHVCEKSELLDLFERLKPLWV